MQSFPGRMPTKKDCKYKTLFSNLKKSRLFLTPLSDTQPPVHQIQTCPTSHLHQPSATHLREATPQIAKHRSHRMLFSRRNLPPAGSHSRSSHPPLRLCHTPQPTCDAQNAWNAVFVYQLSTDRMPPLLHGHLRPPARRPSPS
jgi:hypothetical protein